jgi:hypothetical protein
MTASQAAVLEGISEGFKGKQFNLGLEAIRLGRGSSCTITILDPRVSREHAEIRFENGFFVITDLGSTHGTFVDGVRAQRAQLQSGSRIRLGDTEFSFRMTQDAIPTVMDAGQGRAVDVAPPVAAPPAPRTTSPPTPVQTPQATSPPTDSTTKAETDQLHAPAPVKRSRNKLLIGCGALLIAVAGMCLAAALLVAVFYPGGLSAAADRIMGRATAGYSDVDLALALSVPPVDERPQVLASLGLPDEFDIAVVDVEGGQVRRESWYYYGYGTRVDFVDGTIIWTLDLEPAEEGTIFPAWYDPTVFESGMSIEAASRAAAAASPAGTAPDAIELSEGGEDLAGGVLLVGDQITLAFQDDALVYVETIGVTAGVDR